MSNVMEALTYDFKSRAELSRECGLTDRALREEIRRLKLRGEMIFSSSHTRGYKRATPEEMLLVRREALSRLKKEAELIRRIDEALELEGQMEMEELNGI